MPVAGTEKINFHSMIAYENIHDYHFFPRFKNDSLGVDLSLVPFKMQITDIKSDFVHVSNFSNFNYMGIKFNS